MQQLLNFMQHWPGGTLVTIAVIALLGWVFWLLTRFE